MNDSQLENLSAYLDDELNDYQRKEFEAELAANKKLQNELNIYKRLSNQVVISQEDHEASKRIKAAILTKRRKIIFWKRASIAIMPIAATILIIAVMNFLPLKSQNIITQDDIFNEYSIALAELSK